MLSLKNFNMLLAFVHLTTKHPLFSKPFHFSQLLNGGLAKSCLSHKSFILCTFLQILSQLLTTTSRRARCDGTTPRAPARHEAAEEPPSRRAVRCSTRETSPAQRRRTAHPVPFGPVSFKRGAGTAAALRPRPPVLGTRGRDAHAP